MKHNLLVGALCFMALISCRTNENAEKMAKNSDSLEAVKNFNSAMLRVVKMQDLPDSPKTAPTELSDYKKIQLLPYAIDLIASTGVTRDEISKKTGNDKEQIFKWAVKVYNNRGEAVNFTSITKNL